MCQAYCNDVFEPSGAQGEVGSFDSAATASSSAPTHQTPGDPNWDMDQTFDNGLFLPNDQPPEEEAQPSTVRLGSRESSQEAEPPQAATATGTLGTEIVPYQDRLTHHVATDDVAEADPMSAFHPVGVPSQTPSSDTPAQLSTQIKQLKQGVSVRKSVHRIMHEFMLSHDPEDATNSLKACIILHCNSCLKCFPALSYACHYKSIADASSCDFDLTLQNVHIIPWHFHSAVNAAMTYVWLCLARF